MSTARRWTPSAMWGAVILIATSIPGDMLREAPAFPGLDKAVHGVLYAILAFLCLRALTASRGTAPAGALGIALAAIALFAALDEWHQNFVPGRSADAADWGADVAGATIGATISRTAPRRRGTAS